MYLNLGRFGQNLKNRFLSYTRITEELETRGSPVREEYFCSPRVLFNLDLQMPVELKTEASLKNFQMRLQLMARPTV